MRWMRAAGRGLLVAGGRAGGLRRPRRPRRRRVPAEGRGPLTLATAGDLTGLSRLRSSTDWNRSPPRERVTLVELPDSADETRAQMITELRVGPRPVRRAEHRRRLDLGVRRRRLDLARCRRDRFPLDAFLPPGRRTPRPSTAGCTPSRTSPTPGCCYYRKDILDREGEQPPRTWAELERQAQTLAPKYGLDGYAGQFLPYEGLTVNAAEAVHSAGGTILGDEGDRVTVDSAAAREGLGFLAAACARAGSPTRRSAYKEEESRQAFQDGRLLFLRNWPYVYAARRARARRSPGKFGAVPLPGPDGPGTSVLGGSNLAVSSHCRHPASAADLIAYLTSERVQRQVLTKGSLPPVRAALYEDPELVRRVPVPADPARRACCGRAAPQEPALRPGEPGGAGRGAGRDGGRQTPEAAVRGWRASSRPSPPRLTALPSSPCSGNASTLHVK